MERDRITLTPLEIQLFALISASYAKIHNHKPNDSVYIFGGWVRDKLFNRSTKDYDMLVSKSILKEFIKQLQHSGHKVSVKTITLDEYPKINQTLYNVTIRDMKVKMGITALEIDLEKELSSKDFTINSLCYDVIKGSMVKNRTTDRGLSDLNAKILRTNNSVELALKQAPSRIIRMIRFSLEYGLTLSNEINKYFENKNLRQIARYYNNSFFNQLRKLAKYVDTEPSQVGEFLSMLDKLKVMNLVTLWFDYRTKRIVVFFIKHDLNELKIMMRRDQMMPNEHYVSIRLMLRELVHYHQIHIQIKNQKSDKIKSQ